MKKLLAIFVLIFCTCLYIISTSSKMTEKLTNYRLGLNSTFGAKDLTRGDLYRMSFLPMFCGAAENQEPYIKNDTCQAKKIDLYALCDSFIRAYFREDKYFCNVDSFRFARMNSFETIFVAPDIKKRNILLIESVEREFRQPFKNGTMESFLRAPTSKQNHTFRSNNWFEKIKALVFNPKLNQNLEMNFWDLNLFTPLKELKAELNYNLFKRVDEQVVVSSSGKYLIYRKTVEATGDTGSFTPISDAELKNIIQTLNKLYEKARRLGFDEVYLSLIPNAVTIIEPDYQGMHYNRLIEKIQNSPDLKMKIIDVLESFRANPQDVYRTNDSHWTMKGANLWLNKVNTMLAAESLIRTKESQ
jgi:hypothetical protein